MTNDGLVGFRRAGGVQGAGLVPDLATSLPKPTDGGLTYTFHLRKGVRYSTGAPVLAGDIRRGIERTVVHPALTSRYYASAIVGAQACGTAAEKAVAAEQAAAGLRPERGHRRRRPDRHGDLPPHRSRRRSSSTSWRCRTPSAVPQDTPLDLAPGTLPAGHRPVHDPLLHPEAGRGGRPRSARAGAQPALPRVVARRAARRLPGPDRPRDRLHRRGGRRAGDRRPRRPAVARRAARPTWTGSGPGTARSCTPLRGSSTDYVFLNATKPPFDNLDARRAVAYALDRGALASDRDGLSGPVTCQLIPPDFAAYQPYCPFTLGGGADGSGPGPTSRPRRTWCGSPGPAGPRSFVVTGPDRPRPGGGSGPGGAARAPRLPRLGATIAIRASSGTRRNDWNAGLQDWGADYPAASTSWRASGPATPAGTCNLLACLRAGDRRADRGGARAAGHRPRRRPTTPGRPSTVRWSTPRRSSRSATTSGRTSSAAGSATPSCTRSPARSSPRCGSNRPLASQSN